MPDFSNIDLSYLSWPAWAVLGFGAVVIVGYIILLIIRIVRGARRLRRALRKAAVVVDTNAATTGNQATKMALAGMLSVDEHEPWNTLTLPRSRVSNAAEILASPNGWNIANGDDLKAVTSRMLDEKFGDMDVQVALEIRNEIPSEASLDDWLDAIRRLHQEAGAPTTLMAERLASAQRISAYEKRMRQDGLLTHPISSPLAYDYGRAVALARWGLATKYIDNAASQRIVDQAAEMAFARYGSWEEFGAAYVMGRVIAFDEDSFSTWYEDSKVSLKLLLTADNSPWCTLPWSGPHAA